MRMTRIVIVRVMVLGDCCGRRELDSPRWWTKLSSMKKTNHDFRAQITAEPLIADTPHTSIMDAY